MYATKSASDAANGGPNVDGADKTAPAPPKSYNVEIAKMPGAHGKPDKSHHDGEMDRLKRDIEKVQQEVNNVRALLSGVGPSTNTPQGQRKQKLRAELDELRGQQAGAKGARGKALDELKALQESTSKKIKDLQATRSKSPYKTVADIDAAIARLQASVESGAMKIVDEKRALSEITSLRKSRRTVEGFEAQQKAIDEDRKKAEELRKTLDSPEGRKLSERYDAIKKELDEIQAEFEKSAGSRSKLQEKRNQLSTRLDDLYGERRERSQAYRDAHDAWYAKSQADRERRLEQQRAERQAHEDQKRKEQAAVMREEAALPAFAKEIEDCDVLIAYFSGGATAAAKSTAEAAPSSRSTLPGTKKLEPRKIEADASAYGQAVKKKGDLDDADLYFVGSAGSRKGKGKQGKNKSHPLALGESPDDAAAPSATVGEATKSDLKVPVGYLTALLSLSIPPPTSSADVLRVIDNLKLKKRYFEENQHRKTKERIEEVEKKLAKLATEEGDPTAAANGHDAAVQA